MEGAREQEREDGGANRRRGRDVPARDGPSQSVDSPRSALLLLLLLLLLMLI